MFGTNVRPEHSETTLGSNACTNRPALRNPTEQQRDLLIQAFSPNVQPERSVPMFDSDISIQRSFPISTIPRSVIARMSFPSFGVNCLSLLTTTFEMSSASILKQWSDWLSSIKGSFRLRQNHLARYRDGVGCGRLRCAQRPR